MMAQVESIRQQLPDNIPKSSSNRRMSISTIQNLFRKNNLVDQSLYRVKADAEKLKDDPQTARKFKNWCDLFTKFMDNFILDIHLLDAYPIKNWNIEILEEALKLVTMLLELCELLVETFEDISSPVSDPGTKALRNTFTGLSGVWSKYLKSLVSTLSPPETIEPDEHIKKMCSTDNDALISGATLRELILRNEIYCQIDSFLESASEAAMEECDGLFSDIWSNIPSRERKILNKDEPFWAPRALAFALDGETGIICTGGTQARCDGLPILPIIAKNITRSRLGEAFAEIVDKCNKNCREQATKVRKEKRDMVQKDKKQKKNISDKGLEGKKWDQDDTVNELYEKVIRGNQSEERRRLPTPVENASILSWAFHGEDITSYPPCLRCQMFYTSWTLMGSPTTTAQKRKQLQDGLELKWLKEKAETDSSKDNCCAETVAAAKIILYTSASLIPITQNLRDDMMMDLVL